MTFKTNASFYFKNIFGVSSWIFFYYSSLNPLYI